MLEALGIIIIHTILGAAVGILIAFAGLMLWETFRVFGKNKA